MTAVSPDFETLRRDAARSFAQTMIVIDDEASQSSKSSQDRVLNTLQRPSRQTRVTVPDTANVATQGEPRRSGKHALDAKALIDRAMELGLICSVLKPRRGEHFRKRVLKAAEVADIVCLDWEIYDDGGEAASQIIRDILRKDSEQNGRLRLIAIYTGDTTNIGILGKVFDKIPKTIRRLHDFRKTEYEIESSSGTKIVCLFKKHGVQLQEPISTKQVSEGELPSRLQSEFGRLSEGLLSNVALETLGAIRASSHHVLSKFVGVMDWPYFHHRATLSSPEDAEEYAVNVVLSEVKSSVNKRLVAAKSASSNAIASRIGELADSSEALTLVYADRTGKKSYELDVDLAIEMIIKGLGTVLGEQKPPNSPGKRVFERDFSTLFFGEEEGAHRAMHQFAALTGVVSHPGSHLYRSGQLIASLGLGSIVQGADKKFLMCLQATCDSVRIDGKKSFLFVPLDRKDVRPEHAIPVLIRENRVEYIGLSTSSEGYRAVQSHDFLGCPETGTVNAHRIKYRSGFYFRDVSGNTYRWMADLKRRRALRAAQTLGQSMGRLGFDEFEPFRR